MFNNFNLFLACSKQKCISLWCNENSSTKAEDRKRRRRCCRFKNWPFSS